MQPHTENWKPMWRGAHRIACALSVAVTSLLLLFQAAWLDGAFRYPHGLLDRSIGDSQWFAITTEYFDGVWIRGGTRAWNLLITEDAAEKLRAKCNGEATMKSIAQMSIPIRQVSVPPGTERPAVNLEQRQRQLDEESGLPKGCVLGSEVARDRKAGSFTALFGRVIQIEEWVD